MHYKWTSHKFLKASEASLNEQKQGSEIYFILFYFISFGAYASDDI